MKTRMSAMASAVVVVVSMAATPSQAPDPATGRAALIAADRAFNQATQARRIEGWVEAFGDSGFQFVANKPVTKGRAAVRANMVPAFADTTWTLTWDPDFAQVAQSGDLGYTVGHYTSRRVGADGKPVVRTGKYLTVWRKNLAGAWKVESDIGNPDN